MNLRQAQVPSPLGLALAWWRLHQMLVAMDEINDPGHYQGQAYPRALILAPTRELATQIFREAQKFCYHTRLYTTVVYGGADIRHQITQLDRGCHLLVGTPGRIKDLSERGVLRLGEVAFSALDEAVWEEERREYVQMFRDDADEVVPRALQEGYQAKLDLTSS